MKIQTKLGVMMLLATGSAVIYAEGRLNVGVIKSIKGTAEVRHTKAKSKPLLVGDKLLTGDEVRVSAGGIIIINHRNDESQSVLPNEGWVPIRRRRTVEEIHLEARLVRLTIAAKTKGKALTYPDGSKAVPVYRFFVECPEEVTGPGEVSVKFEDKVVLTKTEQIVNGRFLDLAISNKLKEYRRKSLTISVTTRTAKFDSVFTVASDELEAGLLARLRNFDKTDDPRFRACQRALVLAEAGLPALAREELRQSHVELSREP